MIVSVLLVAAALVVVVLGMLVLEQMIERPAVAIVVVAVAVALDLAFTQPGLALRAGSTKLTLNDATFGLLAAAGVARHLRLHLRSRSQQVAVAFAVLALLSLARGLPAFGESAVNEFRGYLAYIGAVLYFSSVPFTVENRDRLGRAFLAAATVAAGVVVARWAQNFLGIPVGPIHAEFNHAVRVMSGPESYIFGEAFLIAVSAWGGPEYVKRQKWLAGLFLLMTVLLNRRTMWLALIAGLVVLASRDRVWARRVGVGLATVAVIGLGVGIVMPEEGAPDNGQAVAQDATDTGTLAWRIEGWTDLLDDPRTPVEWAIGEPMGAGFVRQTYGRTVDSNPHSFYIETLLRTGAIGVLLLVVLLLSVFGRLSRFDPHADPGLLSRDVLLGILVAHMVWSLAWPPGVEQGIFVGFAIAAVSWRRRPPPEPARPRQRVAVP